MKQFDKETDRRLEELISDHLEQYTFEEFLEEFDLTPVEVFINLYYSGLIDDVDLQRVFPVLYDA